MPQKRPALVWVIAIWKSLGLLFTLLSIVLVYSGTIPLPPAAQEAMSRLTFVDWTISGILVVLAAISIWLLFTLKRPAPFFLTAALLINVGYALSPFGAHMARPGLVGFIGWGVEAAICLYAWMLLADGSLGSQHQKQADEFS